MSNELGAARTKINSVLTLIKQNKYLAAITALHDAVLQVLQSPLMKAEKEEFDRLLDQATFILGTDPLIKKMYSGTIKHESGAEKELVEILRNLMVQFNEIAMKSAHDELENLKKEALEKGQSLLDKQDFDKAREVLGNICLKFPLEAELRSTVADMYIKAGLYEDAFKYLDEALELTPEDIQLYNRIAIVLRKLGKFDVAEKYFLRALEYAKNDSNLYFNLGRVYVDWERWDKVEKAAKLALKIRPDFVEAEKMLHFAQNKIAKAKASSDSSSE